MRLRNEIFENKIFSEMADNSLVMINADFPRSKKNQLDKEKVKQNEILANKYNPNGLFPYTLLMTPDGKVLKSWEGLPDATPEQFTAEAKAICDAHK